MADRGKGLLRTIREAENEEPNEITQTPRRRLSITRRPAPPTRAYPRLIQPIINRTPNDPDEFTDFLAPFIGDGDQVLHLGCQDGSVSFALATKVCPTGIVVGINGPGQDTRRAKEMAQTVDFKDMIAFRDVSDLTKLPFPDGTFDVVYASDIMVHLPPRIRDDVVVAVLAEMKRVTRTGGIVVTRDLAAQHFFPNYDLIELVTRTLFQASGLSGWYGPRMPQFYNRVGLNTVALLSASASTPQGPATGNPNWVRNLIALFAKGTELRRRWIDAGVREANINLISNKLARWGKMAGSWYVCLYTEMIAQKEGRLLVSSDSDSSMTSAVDNTSDSGLLDPNILDPNILGLDNPPDADTPIPDTSVPDTSVPDNPVPGTPLPDNPIPDTSVPDNLVPDTQVSAADDTSDPDIFPDVDHLAPDFSYSSFLGPGFID